MRKSCKIGIHEISFERAIASPWEGRRTGYRLWDILETPPVVVGVTPLSSPHQIKHQRMSWVENDMILHSHWGRAQLFLMLLIVTLELQHQWTSLRIRMIMGGSWDGRLSSRRGEEKGWAEKEGSLVILHRFNFVVLHQFVCVFVCSHSYFIILAVPSFLSSRPTLSVIRMCVMYVAPLSYSQECQAGAKCLICPETHVSALA